MGKKDSLLRIIKILNDKTDENHAYKPTELVRMYKQIYGEDITRQTVSKYINLLEDTGFDIVKNGSSIFLGNRIFSEEETELLCHSVMANNTIPLSYSKDLIEKLLKTQSEHFRNNNNLEFNMINIDKKDNKEIYLNIKTITDAIQKQYLISFKYTKYDINKKLIPRRSERYEVIPCRTVSMANKMYLLCKHARYDDFRTYRIDRMKDIKILKVINLREPVDPYEYIKHRLYMYGGDINEYEIIFDNFVLDEIIDLFGKDIVIKQQGDQYITKVKATETAIIYFACQYMKYIKVISPVEIKEKIRELLKETIERYGE